MRQQQTLKRFAVNDERSSQRTVALSSRPARATRHRRQQQQHAVCAKAKHTKQRAAALVASYSRRRRRRRHRVCQQQAHNTRWRASWRASSAASVSAIKSTAERRTIVGAAQRQLDTAGTRIGQARRDAVLVDCRNAPSCVQRTQLADSASSLSSTSRSESPNERHTAQIDFRRRARPCSSASSATRSRVRRGSLARSLAGINTSKFKVQKCSLPATPPHERHISTIMFFSLANRKLLHLFALS